MGNVIKIAASRARQSRRQADDLVARIDGLREDAERRGLTNLAYFLDIAVTEAMVQAGRYGDVDAGAPSAQPSADPVASD